MRKKASKAAAANRSWVTYERSYLVTLGLAFIAVMVFVWKKQGDNFWEWPTWSYFVFFGLPLLGLVLIGVGLLAGRREEAQLPLDNWPGKRDQSLLTSAPTNSQTGSERWICRDCWKFMPRVQAEALPTEWSATIQAHCIHCNKQCVFFAEDSPEGAGFANDLLWEDYKAKLEDAGY